MKNLYNLIGKLSQSEKRYVKLRLQSTKSASQSLLYFDAISKQDNYSFEELKKIDDKTTPVLRSNLDKLYRSILKQLRIFHSNSTIDSKLQGILSDVKLLQDKGLIKEAKKMNAKLIKQCKENEQFEVLKQALSNYWILMHLSGDLTYEASGELEAEINWCRRMMEELEELNNFYRQGVSLYYSYFFKEKKPAYLEGIKEILKEPLLQTADVFESANARMVFFEVKSLCNMVLGNLKDHHEVRRLQLKLLFTSSIFSKDYLNQLLVTSNLFTYLKADYKLTEFKNYLLFFECYFRPIVKKTSDSVLVEKFFDVYYQNKVFEQQFIGDVSVVNQMVEGFTLLVQNRTIVNRLLISRTYIALAELLILVGGTSSIIPLLIDYQDWDKANKTSSNFIESELLFLLTYLNKGKVDVFHQKVATLKKFINSKKIKLDYNQSSLLNCLEAHSRSDANSQMELDKITKPVFKVFILSLQKNKPIEVIRPEVFKLNKENYLIENDELLNLLQKVAK